jgi:hypothetical protein
MTLNFKLSHYPPWWSSTRALTPPCLSRRQPAGDGQLRAWHPSVLRAWRALHRAVRPYEPPIILSAADTIPYRLLLGRHRYVFPIRWCVQWRASCLLDCLSAAIFSGVWCVLNHLIDHIGCSYQTVQRIDTIDIMNDIHILAESTPPAHSEGRYSGRGARYRLCG